MCSMQFSDEIPLTVLVKFSGDGAKFQKIQAMFCLVFLCQE